MLFLHIHALVVGRWFVCCACRVFHFRPLTSKLIRPPVSQSCLKVCVLAGRRSYLLTMMYYYRINSTSNTPFESPASPLSPRSKKVYVVLSPLWKGARVPGKLFLLGVGQIMLQCCRLYFHAREGTHRHPYVAHREPCKPTSKPHRKIIMTLWRSLCRRYSVVLRLFGGNDSKTIYTTPYVLARQKSFYVSQLTKTRSKCHSIGGVMRRRRRKGGGGSSDEKGRPLLRKTQRNLTQHPIFESNFSSRRHDHISTSMKQRAYHSCGGAILARFNMLSTRLIIVYWSLRTVATLRHPRPSNCYSSVLPVS